MKSHTIFGLGMTALLLGGFAAGGVTFAGTRDAGQEAVKTAGKARKALAKGQPGTAVVLAESAVGLSPRDPGYRLLLGEAYLKAGRFASAGATFADVLALDAGNGRAALNLALTQIAQGRWDAARETLTTHAGAIPARDRGLAWALAGDPAGGVEILMSAARERDADARTRQNLALALALSGQWREAKTVALSDVGEAEATRRVLQWAAFAKPTHASDQVAALLGVQPVVDPGQPTALALAAPADAPVALAAADEPVPAAAPVDTRAPAAAPRIIFAERREVVQPLPGRETRLARASLRSRVSQPVPVRSAEGEGWYVQLGAFDSAGVARDAWGRATRRYAALRDHTPAGTPVRTRRGTFYRLAVGGFVRAEAVALCRGYRAQGGACFVRQHAGDRVAAWAKPGKVMQAVTLAVRRTQVASN